MEKEKEVLQKTPEEWLKTFIEMSLIMYDETDGGIYPHRGMLVSELGNLSLVGLDVKPEEVATNMFRLAMRETADFCLYGIDRENSDAEAQGLDPKYKNLFTASVHSPETGSLFSVTPYNTSDDIGETQFENEFWNKISELEKLFAAAEIVKGDKNLSKEFEEFIKEEDDDV